MCNPVKTYALLFIAVLGLAGAGDACAAVPALSFTVNMSEAVNVDTTGGTPRIAVNVDGQSRYATYASGSGTSALTFTYTATAGDVDLNGIAITSPVDLNGGTIRDLGGNDTALTFTAPNTTGVHVDYPSLSMDPMNGSGGRYTLEGTAYTSLSAVLTAAGGTFTRASNASYFDSTGTLQIASSGTPRFDYDMNTLAARGLLLEEGRTNWSTNSQAAGTVLGTIGAGGALPTNWGSQIGIIGGTGTVTATILATGTLNGLNYIDVRFNGNVVSGTGIADIIFGNSIPTTANATWAISAYVARIGGAMTNVNTSCVKLKYNNNVPAYIGESVSCVNPATATLARTERVATTPVNTASMTLRYTLYFSPGAFDVTMRYAAPQAEFGGFSTSYIPTTAGTTVARAAEVITIPSGSWFNGVTTTISGEYSSRADNTYSTRLASMNDATSQNAYQIANSSTGVILAQKRIAGVNQSSAGPAYVPNTTYKVAGAMDAASSPLAVNNTLYNNSNAGTPIGLSRLQVGNQNGTTILNGWLRKLKYYPVRVSNTQLQILTQ